MAAVEAIGLTGLIRELQLNIPLPAVWSAAGATSRRTEDSQGIVRQVYPLPFVCKDLRDHLRFALRYEPIDLRVWHAVLRAIPPKVVSGWVKEQPASAYARRAWYLYEHLIGRLPLPDSSARYTDLGDGEIQLTWRRSGLQAPPSSRHRVRNNLLGSAAYCPLVRRTPVIRRQQSIDFGRRISEIRGDIDPALFDRAAGYLYLNETKSSFQIEGEKPPRDREARFVAALARAGNDELLSKDSLARLQAEIIQDARFAATGWRERQVYVGRTRLDFTEDVRYPCPAPADLPELMNGWLETVAELARADRTDAVALAACASFGFVYLHPFDDGNGRIHRFLIHHVLARTGYTPPGIIFPVSAAILRRRREYDRVLETVSSMIRDLVSYDLDETNTMTLTGDTIEHYRYPDLTPHAEFLYECVAETVEKDWPEELRFLDAFDRAFRATQAVVDMPDARIRLLVKLLMQNRAKLATGKRKLFTELTDAEIAEIEARLDPIVNAEITPSLPRSPG